MDRVTNFLDAYAEAYDTKDSDTNVVFGVHGSGLILVMNDALWPKYELGKRYSENDPTTGAPAGRNPWARGSESSLTRLRARGVRFIACLRRVRRLVGDLTGADGQPEPVRSELIANLLPGVTPVPATIVAVNRAQEEGLSYAFMG